MRSENVFGPRLASLVLGSALVLGAARGAHAQSVCGDDPEKGDFTIEEATKGLKAGKGALTASIETSMGTFTCELFDKKAPKTVANFVGLARGLRPFCDEKTKKWEKRAFYDGLTFHRVIPGFMIQGGDPLGVGRGGPGYKFVNESDPSLTFDKPGLLAMANAGRDTNGSQFFITEAPQPPLNGGYTLFGSCEPTALVAKIAGVQRSPGDKPVTDVVMKKVTIARGKPGKAAKADAKGEAKEAKSEAKGEAKAEGKKKSDAPSAETKAP